MKEIIIETLRTVNRDGIESLIKFLEESDFFTAPASTKYHGNYEGGLAEHSMNVYQIFKRKVAAYKVNVPMDSIIIAGLMHDICKVNFYKKGVKNVKENGAWIQKEIWEVKDQFPLGHGEKSLLILRQYINLTVQEMLLIRWHMGGFEPEGNRVHMYNAIEVEPAIILLHAADLESSYLLERKEGGK